MSTYDHRVVKQVSTLYKCLDVFSTQLCPESTRPLIMGLIVLPKPYPPRLQNVAVFRDSL